MQAFPNNPTWIIIKPELWTNDELTKIKQLAVYLDYQILIYNPTSLTQTFLEIVGLKYNSKDAIAFFDLMDTFVCKN